MAQLSKTPGFPQPMPPGNNIDINQASGEINWLESTFNFFVWGFALASAAVLFWICLIVFRDAQPAIQEYGLPFLWSREWNVSELIFGALPFIYGTLVTSFLALLLAVPTGLAVALVTSEDFLPPWVRSPVAFLVELIAAIPSVIIGLWGIFVFVPVILPLQQFLFQNLGWIPLFNTEPFGFGMLSAGMVLSIMILPTMAAISRDVLLAVPPDLRSASMSLGASRWETIWKILIPTAGSGMLGAAILALGRALGETMAVTMVIGNSIQISPSLLAPGYTIPAVLANQFGEALDELHIGSLMYLALLLFAITLIVNMIALALVQLIGKKAIQR
jgi:phosphate transport system permease protein